MFTQTISRYADIILYRTIAGIKSESRQRYLGYLWFFLEPLLTTSVFYIAYSQITGNRGPDSILLILVGTLLWQWFEGAIMAGANSIRAKFHVLNQCNLPKFLFPLVSIAVHTWKFFCVSVIFFLFAFAFGHTPNIHWLYLPLLFILQLLLIISISLPISIGVTLWADLQIIVSSVFRIFFFLSGIFFDVNSIPENLREYFYMNPMAVFIDSGRAIILRNEVPALEHLKIAIMTTFALFIVAFVLHAYYDKKILKLTNS